MIDIATLNDIINRALASHPAYPHLKGDPELTKVLETIRRYVYVGTLCVILKQRANDLLWEQINLGTHWRTLVGFPTEPASPAGESQPEP